MLDVVGEKLVLGTPGFEFAGRVYDEDCFLVTFWLPLTGLQDQAGTSSAIRPARALRFNLRVQHWARGPNRRKYQKHWNCLVLGYTGNFRAFRHHSVERDPP